MAMLVAAGAAALLGGGASWVGAKGLDKIKEASDRDQAESEEGAYIVFYHFENGATGRAEPILAMLEEAGAPYVTKAMSELPDDGGYPCFAAPVVQFPGGLRVAQTPALLCTLGRSLGLHPPMPSAADARSVADFADAAHALQCALDAADVLAEAVSASKAAERPAAFVRAGRLAKWLDQLACCLAAGGGEFFIGGALSYVDFATLNALNIVEFCHGAAATSLIAARPALAAWLAAMRARPAVCKIRRTPVLPASMKAPEPIS